MADRKVSVALELNAGQFKTETSLVESKLKGVDRAVEELDRDITKIPADAGKAAVGLEAIGSAADGAKDNLGQLDRKIAELRLSTIGLAKEFDKTGNTDLFKQFRTDRGELGVLTKLKKELETAGAEGGKGFIQGLTSKIQAGIGNLPTVAPSGLTQWLVLGAAAAAPIIGAAVGAAVTLGVGGGVLAAGITAAAQDSRVSTAWGNVFHSAGDQLKAQSSVFVAPLTDAAGSVAAAFDRVIPKIGTDFALLAPKISSLATGASGLIDNIFKGGNFDRVVALSGKLFDKLGTELPNIGNAISNMLGSVAAGGPGIQQFWSDFLVSTEKTVVGIGNVVEALSKTYEFLGGPKSIGARANDAFDVASVAVDHFFTKVNDNIGGKLNDQFDEAWNIDRDGGKKKQVDGLSDAAKQLKDAQDAAAAAAASHGAALAAVGLGAQLSSDDFATLSGQINATSTSSDVLAGAMSDKLLNSMLAGDQATLAFDSSLNRVSESVKTNGHEIDIHTVKGEANRQTVLASVQSNIAQYNWLIKSGAGAEVASAAYDANTAALEQQMHQAHFTQAQIDELIGKYRGVPASVDTDIVVSGLTSAIQGLDETIRLANHLDGKVSTLTVQEIHRTITQNVTAPAQVFHGLATGGIRAYASGGVTAAASGIIAASNPGTILTAEPQTGGEVLIPRLGISNERGLSLANVAANMHGGHVVSNRSAGGGSATVINLNLYAGWGVNGHELGQQVIDAIRPVVNRNGGNVQMAVVGRQTA